MAIANLGGFALNLYFEWFSIFQSMLYIDMKPLPCILLLYFEYKECQNRFINKKVSRKKPTQPRKLKKKA